MKYKKSFIFICLIICLFSIASIAAGDVNDNAIASENTTAIELSQSGEITTTDESQKTIQTNDTEMLTASDEETTVAQNNLDTLSLEEKTYADLSNAVGSGGNINLQPAYYKYNGESDTITITNPGIINGNGAIIDMAGSTIRAFNVVGSGVTIKNLTIKNANINGGGGAIYFSNSGTVENCNFTNNQATGTYPWGGAIMFLGTGNVTNCSFTNNSASSRGGAVYFSSTGNVSNCNFTGNTATGDGGGAVYFNGKGDVINCNFTDNEAYCGGAVFFYDEGTVSNCNFADNTAFRGGAVYFNIDGDVRNCNFTGNTAKYGGAVHFSSTGNVSNCNFTGNTATYYGGAVYFSSTGNVTNCNFTGNKATDTYSWGGAVYFSSTGNVTNCNFTDNKATGTYSYGGAVYFSSTGNVTNCNFTNNKATYIGGAIYFYDNSNVTNCNFTDNEAYYGGAIFSMQWYTTVFSMQWYTTADTCIFKRNSGDNVNTVIYPPTLNVNNFTTVYGSGDKLTFDLKTNSSIPVTNGNISISVYFKDNGVWVRNYTCLSGEGWIPDLPVGSYYAIFDTEYAEFQPIKRTITVLLKHTFSFLNYTINANDNSVINLSNDFYFDPAYDTAFVNGVVINRQVTINGNGSAIDAKGKARIFQINADNVTLKNITFTNGKTREHGGAVYFQRNGTVSNCNFVNNSVSGEYRRGGAVFFLSTGNVTNCNFTANQAIGDGGAVFFNNYGNVRNCNFTDNTATGNGGAVYFIEVGSVTNCNFTNNTANYGGAVYISGEVTVENCNFTDNEAYNSGGAIRFGSTGNVTNCNFTANQATGSNIQGGAIYMDSGSVTNCNFTNNQATGDYSYGGAIYFNSNGNVTNCNFTNNSASNRGGAIYFSSSGSTHTVTNCNFTNNAATYCGAIMFGSTGTVTNCNFANNHANEGGAIYSWNWYTTADTCIFKTGSDTTNINVIIVSPKLNVDNSTIYKSNEKLTFNLTTNSGMLVNDGNISISVYYKNNDSWVDNYSCLSGEGWTVSLPAGYYYAIFNTEYAEFKPINRTITVIPNIPYYANITSISTNNKTVNITAKSNIPQDIIEGKLLFILPNSEEISANYGGNGTWWAVHKFDDYGVYEVNASYTGLDNVTVNNGTITINKLDSTIMLDDITLNYGESKNVTVTTTGATEITASINGTDVTVINNYTIPISGLAAGNYTLNVTTVPDGDHNSVSKEVKIIVYKATAEITVDSATMDIKVLDEVLSGATLTPADAGNLTYKSNNETVVIVKDGKIKALAKGTATITVSFAGNENYTATKNKTISVTVTLKDAIISVNNSTLNLFVDDNFTVVASTNPDGLNVTFVQDDSGVYIVDENGNITALREGTGNILVKVTGNEGYAENSTTVAVTVSKIPTEITLTNTTLDLKVDDEVKINATLTPSEAGELDFTSSDVSVVTVNGIGELTAVGEGIANITVRFLGDDKYVASNATVVVTVNKQDTNVNVSIPENITVGDNSTIDVVLPSDAMGDVTVKVDGEVVGSVQVNDGSVDVTIPSLSAGNHTVEISYSGDGKYNPVNETKKITVYKKDTVPEIIIPSDIAFGDNATVDVKLPSDAEGNVTLTVDGKNYTFDVKNGVANVKLPELGDGNYNYTITYSGDSKYSSFSTNGNMKVNNTKPEDKKPTPEIVIPPLDETSNEQSVKITLPADATGKVTLSINGKEYTYLVENGEANVIIPNLGEGDYPYTITYSGDSKYSSFTTNGSLNKTVPKVDPKITAKNTAVQYSAKGKYSVTVYGTDGKVANGIEVIFKISGKQVAKVKTNAKGVASYVVTKNPGKYKIQATALGKSVTKTVTVKHIVTLKTATLKKSAKKLTLQATLAKVNGKYLKNKKITFKFNGKKYTAKTDKKGVAKVTIKSDVLKKLKVGKKVTYQATYSKDTVKKTAIIKK